VKKKQTRRRSLEGKAIRKAEILSLATIAFIEGGYAAVKMRDIAKELDTSAASLYSYFENKDEILLAILETGLDEFEQRINELKIENTFNFLCELSHIYIEFAERKPHLYQLMFPIGQEINLSEHGIKRIYRLLHNKILDSIKQHNSYFIKWKPEMFVEVYWSILHGAITFSSKVDEDRYMSNLDILDHITEFIKFSLSKT
jgi:AcrR family transcriptional regulator